jgi:hypothetical protein
MIGVCSSSIDNLRQESLDSINILKNFDHPNIAGEAILTVKYLHS